MLKSEIRETEKKRNLEANTSKAKFQKNEETPTSNKTLEIGFVKDLFINLIKKVPENIRINDFIIPAFKILQITDKEISMIAKERKKIKHTSF